MTDEPAEFETIEPAEAVELMERLGRSGLTVSICYGPCGGNGLLYSVNVLTGNLEEFERPFGAGTFAMAVQIAEEESGKRGWIQG